MKIYKTVNRQIHTLISATDGGNWSTSCPSCCFTNRESATIPPVRGSVRSTRGLGRTMTARGQSIGISIGMLPQTLIMSITVQKTSKYYTTEFDLEEGFLNGACISISNLPENIAWQTHKPEARGPLKSGAWGGRPTCHPQTPPLSTVQKTG